MRLQPGLAFLKPVRLELKRRYRDQEHMVVLAAYLTFIISNPHGDLKLSITPVPESDTSNPGARSTFTYINAGSFVIYKSIDIKNTCEVKPCQTHVFITSLGMSHSLTISIHCKSVLGLEL